MKIKFILITFFLIQPFYSNAQLPDGVLATQSFINIIKANYINENAFLFDLNNIKLFAKIPVRVYIIKNIEGVAGIRITDINNGISSANTFFKNIGIQFTVDSINYINDYNYSFITRDHNRVELLTLFAKPGRINLFLADSIKLGAERSYGFTYFPDEPDSNFIFLDKKYVEGNYLSTMLGHFMGLFSTHETLGGASYASETNCSTSGDFICDTYADPDIFGMVDINCQYTGNAMDPGHKYYVPSVANIMSNSADACKCIFSPLQYRRMYFYFLKYRQYLKG
jgi:hypothetical protein